MGYISGESREQSVLFPGTLDDYIERDNPVRAIEAFAEGRDMSQLGFERAEAAETGRPGFDPRDMVKLYLYGYLNGIRSSRKLEKEAQRNVEVLWLLKKLAPDYKTIADFRRDTLKPLNGLFTEFVKICRRLELFSADLVGIDGSKFKAVNGKGKNYRVPKLDKLLEITERRIQEYFDQMDIEDREEDTRPEVPRMTKEELKKKIEILKERKAKYESLKQQLAESGEKQISTTDPDSRLMPNHGSFDVCFNVQAAVDEKHKLVVAFDVTNEATDSKQLVPMASKAKEALGVEALEVVADKGYYDSEQLLECRQNQILPLVPRKSDKAKMEKMQIFGKEVFLYDKSSDSFRCPAGQELIYRFSGFRQDQQKMLRYYWTDHCRNCSLVNRCTTNKQKHRRMTRWEHEDFLDEIEKTVRLNRDKYHKRQEIIEHVFGTLKRAMNHGYFLLKGRTKVTTEAALSFLAYDFKRVISILGTEKMIAAMS